MSDQAGSGDRSGLGVRVGLAAAVGLGALASGFLLTRPGRRLVADVFGGKQRSPLESRVLEELWEDRVLGRRRVDVREAAPGRVVLTGRVRSRDEVGRALALAERTRGVVEVEDALEIEPARARR